MPLAAEAVSAGLVFGHAGRRKVRDKRVIRLLRVEESEVVCERPHIFGVIFRAREIQYSADSIPARQLRREFQFFI